MSKRQNSSRAVSRKQYMGNVKKKNTHTLMLCPNIIARARGYKIRSLWLGQRKNNNNNKYTFSRLLLEKKKPKENNENAYTESASRFSAPQSFIRTKDIERLGGWVSVFSRNSFFFFCFLVYVPITYRTRNFFLFSLIIN